MAEYKSTLPWTVPSIVMVAIPIVGPTAVIHATWVPVNLTVAELPHTVVDRAAPPKKVVVSRWRFRASD